MISRRQLLYLSALLSIGYPVIKGRSFAAADDTSANQYPLSIEILTTAYWSEMIAYTHYCAYCQKALSENYPNISYLFTSLSVSEKIHSENYKKLIIENGATLGTDEINVSAASTKENLKTATTNELKKITKFYPDILKKLSEESYDQAIVNCMYSWKSHQQHEEIIREIKKYSGLFFSPLAKKIEQMDPNYYVCEVCGSTIDEKPQAPCTICNRSMSHYTHIKRPVLVTG